MEEHLESSWRLVYYQVVNLRAQAYSLIIAVWFHFSRVKFLWLVSTTNYFYSEIFSIYGRLLLDAKLIPRPLLSFSLLYGIAGDGSYCKWQQVGQRPGKEPVVFFNAWIELVQPEIRAVITETAFNSNLY